MRALGLAVVREHDPTDDMKTITGCRDSSEAVTYHLLKLAVKRTSAPSRNRTFFNHPGSDRPVPGKTHFSRRSKSGRTRSGPARTHFFRRNSEQLIYPCACTNQLCYIRNRGQNLCPGRMWFGQLCMNEFVRALQHDPKALMVTHVPSIHTNSARSETDMPFLTKSRAQMARGHPQAR